MGITIRPLVLVTSHAVDFEAGDTFGNCTVVSLSAGKGYVKGPTVEIAPSSSPDFVKDPSYVTELKDVKSMEYGGG
ncbi:hypothetical protein TNCV_5072401 [Trichonephila clavipes]|nr:hypothetical protein TNCV_5072401 [Trichonephila clavipes]